MTWIPKQLTREQIEERRLAGGKLLKEGRLSKAQIAHKLGVSRAAVIYGRRVLSTAVGVTISGRIYERPFNKAITSEAVVETLKHLRRPIRGPSIVVGDRASIHRSKKGMAYLAEHPAIPVEGLPPCAPDINPEEFCHSNLKAHE